MKVVRHPPPSPREWGLMMTGQYNTPAHITYQYYLGGTYFQRASSVTKNAPDQCNVHPCLHMSISKPLSWSCRILLISYF